MSMIANGSKRGDGPSCGDGDSGGKVATGAEKKAKTNGEKAKEDGRAISPQGNDVVDPADTIAAMGDPFALIGDDALYQILALIPVLPEWVELELPDFGSPNFSSSLADWHNKITSTGYQNAPAQLREACRTLSLVCKRWHKIAGRVVNQKAPPGIISPQQLYELKLRINDLDLSPIMDQFVIAVKARWDEEKAFTSRYQDPCSVLQVIVDTYTDGSVERFADLVASEYKCFLLVVCVEHMAKIADKSTDDPSDPIWKTHRIVAPVLRVFWEAHRSDMKKYESDCTSITGEVLDLNSHFIDGQDGKTEFKAYREKKDSLFYFEKRFSKHCLHFTVSGMRFNCAIADLEKHASDIHKSNEQERAREEEFAFREEYNRAKGYGRWNIDGPDCDY